MGGKELTSKSWAITFRPKHGVTDKLEKDFVKLLKKKQYHAMSIEGEDESRHIHAQFWQEKETRKSDFKKSLVNMLQRHNEETCELTEAEMKTQSRYGIYLRKPWNANWIEEYCQKDGDLTLDNRPMDVEWDLFEQSCYPTKEEQAKIMRKAHCVDHYYNRLLELWEEFYSDKEPNNETVAEFLSDMMFCRKKIRVVDRVKWYNLKVQTLAYIKGEVNKYLFMSNEEKLKIFCGASSCALTTGDAEPGKTKGIPGKKRDFDEISEANTYFSEGQKRIIFSDEQNFLRENNLN